MWYYRLIAVICAPLLLVGVFEVGLRLAGFGYPTNFLLKSSNRGEDTFVQNNQFGWRFFGPRIARVPEATSIPRDKPTDTIRIFVFGESAAYGDPQPRFGLPRMLQAILELRHPGKKFEVVNAAMTGINSHAILPLARDCEKARADVWVIYMGNNEVVGPFGAGTVFGNQTTPLPLIRATLALKTTRLGQFLDSLRRAAQKTTASGEWEGMGMFVKYKLAESDLRLAAVYENFKQNLDDIIAAGRKSGAKIVLSTVAVNLKDCAPFASLHRSDLSESQQKDWQRLFDAGVKAQESGDIRGAALDYEQAQRIDENFAELRFRRGQCALALQDVPTARKEFTAARDLDALRFRCDSRLNDLIRQQAAGETTLADSERTLAEKSADGIPGKEFFYEHVHLTFQGNYALARTLAEKVEGMLDLSENSRWPEILECAQRLGYTQRDAQLALSTLFGRLSNIPFTLQSNHEEEMRRLAEESRQLPPSDSAAALKEAQSTVEPALARWPGDVALLQQMGEIKQAQGDFAGARAAIERSLEKLPSDSQAWQLCGILLAQEQKYGDATAAFKRVLALDPQAVWASQNLAMCFEKLGRRDDAVAEVKHALTLKPDYGTAWLALGQLYEAMGHTNDAEQCYQTAVTNRVNQPDDLAALARFCASRGWYDLASTNFAAAIQLSPSDPGLRMENGRVLSALGKHVEAARQYQSAVQLAPNQPQPHMQLGVELGRLGQPVLAEQEFRQALRADPEFTEARANLGIALYKQEKLEDASKVFDEVLQRNPHDPTALHYAQLLQNRKSLPAQ